MRITRLPYAVLALIVLGLLAGPNLWAQSTVDPQDPIYRQLEIWEAAALIGNLPPQRPFAPSFVIEQLKTVIASGKASKNDRDLANWYLSYFYRLHPGLEATARTDLKSVFGQGDIAFWGQGPITPWLDASVQMKVWGVYQNQGNVLPAYTELKEDFITDQTSSGKFAIRQFGQSAIDVKIVDGLTAHAGLHRNSIGPFGDNGIILGPQSPAAGAFFLRYEGGGFSLSNGFYPITATRNDGTGYDASKFLYYHQLDVAANKWLDFSVYETIVGGPSANPRYFIPLSSFFHSQSVGGFGDNSFIGIGTQVHPLDGLRFKGLFYMDDMQFNDLLVLKLNSKWKYATQVGAVWVPSATFRNSGLDWLSFVQFDYTAIMPYTYTHESGDTTTSTDYNYQNYTNRGLNMGPVMQPDSDRFNLETRIQPVQQLSLDLALRLYRHGNASSGILDSSHDGSILDDGRTSSGQATWVSDYNDPTGQPVTRFLSQSTIEHIVQVRTGVTAILGSGLWGTFGTLKGELAHTFEAGWNRSTIDGNNSFANYLSLSFSYWY